MTHLINALREAAPDVRKEYCSPYGDLMDSAADEIERLHRAIADIGEAMRTKANNNPGGVKASTLEMLGEELLSALPSNA